MRSLAEFAKTTLIGGVLVLVPIYLSVLLLLKALGGVMGLVSPITEGLPRDAAVARSDRNAAPHRGMLRLRSRGADRARIAGEERVRAHRPRKDPGLRAHPRADGQNRRQGGRGHFRRRAGRDRGRARAGLPDRGVRRRTLRHLRSVGSHARCGSIYIIAKARVHPVDVPFTLAISVISKWGSGSSELLAGMKRARLRAT